MTKYIRQLLENLDTVLAILLSLVAAVFGVFGIYEQALLPAIATALALVAASVIRDRNARDTLQSEIRKLDSTIHGMSARPSADTFFRRSNTTSDLALIDEAKEEIWLIQETGSLVLEQPGLLRDFVRKGGMVKMILVGADPTVVEGLVLRNPDVKMAADMTSRQANASQRIEALSRDIVGAPGQLEIRRIAYPLDITAVFKDPEAIDTTKRMGLIRLVGFRSPFKEKREFSITFSAEPETYQYFIEQFRQMWNVSQ